MLLHGLLVWNFFGITLFHSLLRIMVLYSLLLYSFLLCSFLLCSFDGHAGQRCDPEELGEFVIYVSVSISNVR